MQIPGAGGLRYKERLDVKTYNIGLRFLEESSNLLAPAGHDLSDHFAFPRLKLKHKSDHG